MTNETQQGVLTKQPIATGAKQGYGELLMKTRKQKVMSLEDVASELNILKRHVEAIETEDYALLPQYAFARGFVRNYARLLGLDSDELVRQFEIAYPSELKQDKVETIKAPMEPMGTLNRGHTRMRINVGLVLGVLAVVIFGVLILKMINSAKTTQNQTLTHQTVLNTSQDSLSATEQAQGAAIGTGSALGASTAVDETNSETHIIETGASSVVLDFWLNSSTQIDITDSTGQTLMTGEKSRGGHQLTGTPPITLTIQNPKSVDLNINKKPIKLAEYTVGDTATLTVR